MSKQLDKFNKKLNNEENMRLNKYLSDMGVCSRREADRLIEQGKVTVNNVVAVMGQRVSENDLVAVNQIPVDKKEQKVLLALYKPVGIECTTDLGNPDNIVDFVGYDKRVYPIGRLDKNSEGLILLTNEGGLVNKIMRGSNYKEKEYIVTVNKKINSNFIKCMSQGVEILDTVTRPCKVTQIDDKTFNIILTQGLNRQIRRMCETLGYKVIKLKRTRIMNIKLGNLKKGKYRQVTEQEIAEMFKLFGENIGE